VRACVRASERENICALSDPSSASFAACLKPARVLSNSKHGFSRAQYFRSTSEGNVVQELSSSGITNNTCVFELLSNPTIAGLKSAYV
jgi:hypothetical protein